jgi:hypothetical protein
MFKRMFQDAERLTPPPGLWLRIAERVDMENGPVRVSESEDAGAWWRGYGFRAVASLVLAASLFGLGMQVQHHIGSGRRAAGAAAKDHGAAVAAAGARAKAEGDMSDIIDPDLMTWHADLGEVDANTDVDETEDAL